MKRILSKKISLWDAIHIIAYGNIDTGGDEWIESKTLEIMEELEIDGGLAFQILYSPDTDPQTELSVEYRITGPCADEYGDLCRCSEGSSCTAADRAALALSSGTQGGINSILLDMSGSLNGEPPAALVSLVHNPQSITPEFAIYCIVGSHVRRLSRERFNLAVDSIVTAAINGDLIATGVRKSGVDRETIDPDTWAESMLDPIAGGENGEGELRHKANYLKSPDDHTFRHLRFQREQILAIAEALREDEPTGKVHKSGRAQTLCYEWLDELMKKCPKKPKEKPKFEEEAKERFRGLTGRGFINAWGDAVKNNPDANWGDSGPIKKEDKVQNTDLKR